MRNSFVITLLFAGAMLLGACNSDSSNVAPATTTPTPMETASPAGTPIAGMRTITGTNTIENKDGSTTVVTNYSDGSRTEVRTFKNGRLARVTRETNAAGARTARVTYREDSTEVEVDDPSWVEKAMDATGDALATAAHKTKAGVKKGINETGDKAEDVGDATKKAAREVGDKAEDVGDAVKKGAKKAGKKVKDVVKPDNR